MVFIQRKLYIDIFYVVLLANKQCFKEYRFSLFTLYCSDHRGYTVLFLIVIENDNKSTTEYFFICQVLDILSSHVLLFEFIVGFITGIRRICWKIIINV